MHYLVGAVREPPDIRALLEAPLLHRVCLAVLQLLLEFFGSAQQPDAADSLQSQLIQG